MSRNDNWEENLRLNLFWGKKETAVARSVNNWYRQGRGECRGQVTMSVIVGRLE